MLEIRDLSYSIAGANGNGKKDILRNVDLTLEDNSFVVITGPNGSGKSTLAKMVMGILHPTSGRIFLNGQDITDLGVTERARLGIGFAFQQPVRFKGLTVLDLLRTASGRDLSLDQACGYLSAVGLCADEYVQRELSASLSGGELKRIEIAMLLARNTKISIFDEPEAGIDLWSFHHLIQVFEKIHNQNKGTVIIISHQERILDIADRIVVLAEGRVKKIGGKDEILPGLLAASTACTFYREPFN